MTGIIVLVAYAAVMMAATLLFTRKTTNMEEFHVADRNVSTIPTAMSIASTWIWAPSLFVSAEKAYTSGIPGMFWFLVPNVLCLIIFIPFAKRIRREYPCGITLTGYMTQKYKSNRVKAVYSFQLGALAVLSTAVQLLAGSKLLALITGLPFWALTIILAAIAYMYSQFSGIKASIATDVVQLSIILGGCALLVPWMLSETGGLSTVIAGLGSITGDMKSLTSESGIAVFFGFGLPTAIGLTSGPFGDQCFWQRVYTVKKNRIGLSFFLGALFFALVPISMGSIGYMAAGMGYNAADPSMVNFEIISSMLPAWVIVPFLFMIISGLLSTVDSNLCAAASMTTDYIIDSDIKDSKMSMLALLAVAIGIANIPGLTVTMLFLFYGTLRASTLLPTAMTLLGKRFTGNAVFIGVLCSLIVGLPIFAYGNLANSALFKTVGSLLTVLMSGVVATLLSRKGAKV